MDLYDTNDILDFYCMGNYFRNSFWLLCKYLDSDWYVGIGNHDNGTTVDPSVINSDMQYI